MLYSDRLAVEVMDPLAATGDRYNTGLRFTPLAAVLGVTMDGHTYLYNPIEHDQVSDHGGLASEFDLVTPDDPDAWMPPGYHDAAPGEGFVKVGVGVLAKPATRYSLFSKLTAITLPLVQVTWQDSAAAFTQSCQGVNGYAYELTAWVECVSNRLKIDWQLTNTGTKPLTTRQYAHNFFRFDEHDVGPGYVLHFPYDFQAQGLMPQQQQHGRQIHFQRRIPQWVNLVVPYPQAYQGFNQCVLEHHPGGQRVTCLTSMAGMRTAIHGRPDYVSPEQFIQIQLTAGQTARWERGYVFESNASIP